MIINLTSVWADGFQIPVLRQARNVVCYTTASLNLRKLNAYPQIILLNGASSSGKSTLAKELQKRIVKPYFYYSSDQLVDSNKLPNVDRINNDTDISWNIIRPKFFNGFQQSIAAFATSGLFLIIEHIVEY